MKKYCLACMIVLTLSSNGFAQFMELNFDCSYFDENNCSPFVNNTLVCARGSAVADDWYASHGSPNIISGFPNTGNSRWGVFKALEVNGVFVGEGLYIAYNFVKGRRYQLEIIAKKVGSQAGGRMRFQAANGLTANGVSSCIESALPFIWEKEDIYILSHAQGIEEYKRNFLPPQFIPSKNYSQLWIYLEEIYPGMASQYHIEYLTIQDLGIETTPGGEPVAPSSLGAYAVAYDQVLLQWQDNSNNEAGFHLMWCVVPCSSERASIYLPANTRKFVHNGRDPQTRYAYIIGARWTEAGIYPPLEKTKWDPGGYRAVTTLADECPTDIVYDHQSNILYTTKSSNSIETGNDFLLHIGFPVIFSAGDHITFKAPSKIQAGSQFRAVINPCMIGGNSFSSSMSSFGPMVDDPAIDQQNEVFIYPNPTNGSVAVYFKDPISKNGYLQLHDKASNKVYSRELLAGETEVHLELPSIRNGIYYLHVITGGKKIIEKLVISK